MENSYYTQLKTVSNYWESNIASRYMVSIATGIPIQNICRYVDMLKAVNSIAIIRKDYCKITGELVEYLTTNKELFPHNPQLKLFD